MERLNFYTVDLQYVEFLKNAEQENAALVEYLIWITGRNARPNFFAV